MSRNKIKFRHSFVSAQVFRLPSSTRSLEFPNKVCDIDGHNRGLKAKQLKEQLKSQRFIFQKIRIDNEKALQCINSFLIAQRIAQTMKPYSDGNFVKQCLTDVVEEMCPEMVQEFEKISLSRWTMARRITSLCCVCNLSVELIFRSCNSMKLFTKTNFISKVN